MMPGSKGHVDLTVSKVYLRSGKKPQAEGSSRIFSYMAVNTDFAIRIAISAEGSYPDAHSIGFNKNIVKVPTTAKAPD